MKDIKYKLTLDEHVDLGDALRKLSNILEYRICERLRCIPAVSDTGPIDLDVAIMKDIGRLRGRLDTLLSREHREVVSSNCIYIGWELNEQKRTG